MLEIEKIIEAQKHPQDQRDYFGVSQIGEPCERAKWYTWRLCTPPRKYTERQKRLFGRGHKEEPIFLKDLKKVGVKIIDTQTKTDYANKYGSGHCDGIIANVPGFGFKKSLLELKTAKNAKFTQLKNSISDDHGKALYTAFPEYYIQVQVYMYLYKLQECLFIMVNKDNDERIYLQIKFDKKFAKKKIKKTTKLLYSYELPEKIGNENYYRCRPYYCKITGKKELFCDHREICHLGAKWQKTCRTCKYHEMIGNGEWYCNKHKNKITFKKQLKACKFYKKYPSR